MKSRPRNSSRRFSPRAQSLLSHAVLSALLASPCYVHAQATYSETGVIGNVESWRSQEFKLDWGLERIGADYAYARGLTGAGIRLGVLDDGTDIDHADLAGAAQPILVRDAGCASREFLGGAKACFYNDGDISYTYVHITDAQRAEVESAVASGEMTRQEADQVLGKFGLTPTTHGTHVAGTMVAHRDGSGMHGVAFGANVMASGANTTDTYQDFSAVFSLPGGQNLGGAAGAEAYDDMYAQMAKGGVRAINNSWGAQTEPKTAAEMDRLAASTDFKESSSSIQEATHKYGYLQVFAAGNDSGQIAGTMASLPRYDAGLEAYWLSVANQNANGQLDESASICGLSKDWCITAPGTEIASTIPEVRGDVELLRYPDGSVQGFRVIKGHRQCPYPNETGSSMAAPHVTGGLALLMERYPYLDNPQIRDVLLTTATDLGQAGVDDIYGWGLMNLRKAIDGPGSLRVDTDVVMNQAAGGMHVWEGPAWDDWRNDISGPGRLTKSGAGWLRLSGNNRFAGAQVRQGVLELDGANALTGDTVVAGGELLLNGQLIGSALYVDGGVATVKGVVQDGATYVGAAGTVRGTGTLATTEVAGTIAPGIDTVGTLKVNGDYRQLPGSYYQVERDASGAADRIDVSGTAEIQGGQVVLAGEATLGERYRIVNAARVQGQYDGAMGIYQPFLALNLDYTPTSVDLAVGRGAALASVATTPNAINTAAAADASADASPMVRELTRLSASQAAAAFDRINGEVHASQQAVLVLQGQRMAESTLARTRATQDAFSRPDADRSHNGVWVELQRQGGHLNNDGNAARTQYNSHGLTVGFDREFGEDWLVGGSLSHLQGDTQVRDRAARSEHRSDYFALYGGKQWGAFGVRAGWVGSRHRIDSQRQVQWDAHTETDRGRQDARGQQAFLEAGYRIPMGSSFHWEPFAQWSRVQVKSRGFVEAGGLSALDVASATQRVDFTTAGVRLAADLSPGAGQHWLQLGGALAYRHASGDLAAASTAAWASGGRDFTVWGAPIGKNATLLNLDVGARLSPHSLLQLGYGGQFSRDNRDHGIQARYSLDF